MRRFALAALAMATPLLAVYTYLYSDPFSSISGTYWTSNGLPSGSANGLISTSSNGGSVIFNGSVGTKYEVKATLKIVASGGTFVLYTRASSNALTGPAAQGTYYSVEMTPTLSGGGCSMLTSYYKRAGGAITLLAQHWLACQNNMSVRVAQGPSFLMLSTSLNEMGFAADAAITSGQPGFGAISTPLGNSISLAQIGPDDTTPPLALPGGSIRSAVFDNRVDFEWPGMIDDTNGAGIMLYQIYRDGVYRVNLRFPNWSDTTVAPGTSYTYSILGIDHFHNVTSTTVTVTTPAAGTKDPRKAGVRPLGNYWGSSPENIDLQSGNLSFSLPTVTAQGRGGTAVPFRLSYNSQNWRKDPGGTWKLGTDVGFGFGWKLLVGSLAPIYQDWWTVHHYVYTDSTGAEYRLDVNSGGVWTSREGIFVEYDSTTGRLYFPSGVYWEFGCQSNGTEADAGTLYPTRLVDTNGNEIKIRYNGALGYGGTNGSARIAEVEDVRALNWGPGYKTYMFNYNADPVPHLTSISSNIGDGQHFGLTYSGAVGLTDPFAGSSFGSTQNLNSMTVPGGGSLQFSMEYNAGSQELKKVTMPYGGTLEWAYAAKTLLGNRTQMEVEYRTLNAQDGQGAKLYQIWHGDVADQSLPVHGYTAVRDHSTNSEKVWFFNPGNDFRQGLLGEHWSRTVPGYVIMNAVLSTWSQTANGNPYVSRMLELIDPGVSGIQRDTATEQTIDDYGNLTVRRQYGYVAAGGTPPLLKTYNYTYLNSANYTSRRIRNRVVSATVQKPGGSVITLVSNTYDIYPFNLVPHVSNPSLLRQHDTANYGNSFIYRGNVTRSTGPGKAGNLSYNITGANTTVSDDYGHSAGQTPDSARNYAVPSAMVANGLTTSFSWNGYNAMTGSTGPNSATAAFSYDGYARPASKTLPSGQVVTYTYSTSAPHWTRAVTGSRWTHTTIDGFGRTVKVETGHGGTTVSVAETRYAPCACSPMGKVWKTSLPYAPGGTVYWTEYLYDALGRTVSVIQPNNRGTTTYTYAGVEVTVTDPAGKWKRYENDASGNLIKVTEPNPAGGADYVTGYAYSELGQLLTSTMTRPGMGSGNGATVTQTRTWVYDGTTQRLNSVTHPESGTTSFAYNADGSLLRKTDAKGQKIEYVYDGNGRVTIAKRLIGSTEDTCQRVTYYYDSQTFDASFTANAAGRLAATSTGCSVVGAGQLIEMYSYNPAGAVTKKRLRIVRSGGTIDKDVLYGYTGDGKLSTVLYPDTSVPFTYTYDLMDRPVKMTGPSVYYGWQTIDHAKDVAYNAAGQVGFMKYLQYEEDNGSSSSPGYFTEASVYDELYQMTRRATTGVGGTAMDISYLFHATQNNGRITGRKNWMNGQEVQYQYDALNRLISASTVGAGGWGQSFTYDGFGNLWSQTPTKGTAPSIAVNLQMATNRINSYGYGYDGNGNTVSMPAVGGGTAAMTFDVDNRMTSWTGGPGTEEYGYLADNKRVWKKDPSGVETYSFYGVGGQKLVTYMVASTFPFVLSSASWNVYFGGKLIRANGETVVADRLGSVVARQDVMGVGGPSRHDYFPYGAEMGWAAPGNKDKFGTYHRDATTGMDYADQRYFTGLQGRFLTADGSGLNESLAVSISWNQYAYVSGDPVNYLDPDGLACRDVRLAGWDGIPDGMSVGALLAQQNDISVLSQTIFTESEAGVADNDSALDRAAIAASIMNRWALVNGNWDVIAQTRTGGGPIRLSDWGKADGTIASVVFAPGQYEPWDSAWKLNPSAQARLNSALNSSDSSDECAALLQSIGTAAGFWSAKSTDTLYETEVNGRRLYLTSFSAPARGNQPTKAYYEEWIGSFGSANVFSGIHNLQVVPRGSLKPWQVPRDPSSRENSGIRRRPPGAGRNPR